MIVLFDANALTSTPFHNAWWKVLALASDDWNIQILIPRVSFEEMVAKAERDADKLIKDLASIAGKAGNTPGFQAALADLRTRRAAVRTKLTQAAEAVGAAFVDPVNVPAMEIVRRQTQRVRPCKENGDGYRDTLNWLTVLDIAGGNPGQEVVWVSADKDFAASRRVLHQELIDEADAAGVADRLSLWPSIDDLVQNLLEQRELDQDADAAHLALAIQAIQRYVAEEAARMLLANGRFTDEDILVYPKPAEVEVEQPAADCTGWVFGVRVYVITGDGGGATPGYAAASGTVTTDANGKPLTGQITEVDWQPRPHHTSVSLSELPAVGQLREAMLPPDLHARLQAMVFPAGLRTQLQEAMFPADLRAQIQRLASNLNGHNSPASGPTSPQEEDRDDTGS